MKKIFNVGGLFKVASNALKTQFGLASLVVTNSTPVFPAMEYGSWGDPHDSIKFKGLNRTIASWDDNDGDQTNELFLLYIKTSTADIKIYKKHKQITEGSNILVNDYIRVDYNGNSVTYNDYSTTSLNYQLGTNCNLTLNLIGHPNAVGAGYYDFNLIWDDIPNLQKIGGGIGTVIRQVAINSPEGSGKPSFWNGGYGGVSGYNRIPGFSKSDLVAAANSSPGNPAFDKVVFNWSSSSELKPLVAHTPASIVKNVVKKLATLSADTDTVNFKNHGLIKGCQICFKSSTAGGVSANTQYYVNETTTDTFTLASSLVPNAGSIDITSNGAGEYFVGDCIYICPPPEEIARIVEDFDPLPPPPFVSTPVSFIGGIDLDNIP